ncbi:TerB family tellurite resistance protein [Polycladidibacter stylochi]|uniref:tellurite resistance TerB family protein n=1 Tax=Polycladidibacter stylochi TaxID=1807766 RepID=UPI0008303A9B|nr:TerB family tellurite resistance protein [Pseudovibrio stylochi]
MLDILKTFLGEITKQNNSQHPFDDDDVRLAAAALMFHIIAVDGQVDANERDKLHELLCATYNLSNSEASELMALAQVRDEEAVDLYSFTSVLKRKLEIDDRIHLVKLLWEVGYVDGRLHEFEDNAIWRIAELLGVSSRDRLEMKHKVANTYKDKPKHNN